MYDKLSNCGGACGGGAAEQARKPSLLDRPQSLGRHAMRTWEQIFYDELWRSDDGSWVKRSRWNRLMPWMAYYPDPSTNFLYKGSASPSAAPRQWKTAQAAMKAVDRECPYPWKEEDEPR